MNDHADPSPLRSIVVASDRWLRTPLALAGSAVVIVFLTGWWASSVWRDIQDLKAGQKKQSDDIAEIKAWLIPNPSRPVISQTTTTRER